MRFPLSLFGTAFHLYGIVLENPAPPGCSDELWDGLLEKTAELYGLAAYPAASRDEAWVRLHDLARCAQHCLALLIETDMRAPVVRCAWRYIRAVVDQIDDDLQAMSVELAN